MTALEKCSRAEYNSIAFPAIGMGTKGYSSTSVAETMIRAITEHCVSHPKTSIKRVVLYLHPGDAKSVSVRSEVVVLVTQKLIAILLTSCAAVPALKSIFPGKC